MINDRDNRICDEYIRVGLEHIQDLSISRIADFILRDWKKPYFGAVPYIRAMDSMATVNDNYGLDSGREIVLRFLCNANTWRGPTAKAVKAELNRRLKS